MGKCITAALGADGQQVRLEVEQLAQQALVFLFLVIPVALLVVAAMGLLHGLMLWRGRGCGALDDLVQLPTIQPNATALREKGQINKLESIAVRKVELVDAGTDASEDFVTLLTTANLLDYTIDERSNEIVSGSMTEPVKFAEKWTWARPVGTLNWKLEGVEVVTG